MVVVSESQLVITWRYEYDRSILICDKPGGYRGGIVNLAFMIKLERGMWYNESRNQ